MAAACGAPPRLLPLLAAIQVPPGERDQCKRDLYTSWVEDLRCLHLTFRTTLDEYSRTHSLPSSSPPPTPDCPSTPCGCQPPPPPRRTTPICSSPPFPPPGPTPPPRPPTRKELPPRSIPPHRPGPHSPSPLTPPRPPCIPLRWALSTHPHPQPPPVQQTLPSHDTRYGTDRLRRLRWLPSHRLPPPFTPPLSPSCARLPGHCPLCLRRFGALPR